MCDLNERKKIITQWYYSMNEEQRKNAFIDIVIDCEEDALISIRSALKKYLKNSADNED